MWAKNLIIIFAQVHGTNASSQTALASAFCLYKCFVVARSLGLDTYNISSLNTENKEHRHKFIWRVYLQRWTHHRQRSGDCKSYSNVGSAVAHRDIKCGFHTASMKHHDIKLTLARHDQSTNSSAPYGDFLQLIGSCFKQGKSEIGGKIKCSQT